MNGTFLCHGFARAGFKRLVALTLVVVALPCLVSAQTLLHRYSFVSNANDSVGDANGTVVAPATGYPAATIDNGLMLPGSGGGNVSGYVTLPAGILTATTNLTIECWVTQNSAEEWGAIWSFANNESEYLALCPYPNRNGDQMIVENNPDNNEIDLSSDVTFPNGSEQYVVLTVNASALLETLYTNGAAVGTFNLPNSSYVPGAIGGAGGTTINQLGDDIYGDPQFDGTIYELRIWNGVVPERYIQASAITGPSTVLTDLTPTSVSLSAGPSVVITGTEQVGVTVQLEATGSTNLLATSDATNWMSSNPKVLEVNSNGLVTGVSAGTATVSATVGGVTATSGTITVTGPQTLLHRYSFVSDASDSVGGSAWNGTLVTGLNGSVATIDNGLSLPGTSSGNAFGESGYAAFPSGILTNTTSLTIECWATQTQGNLWAELWDFGDQTPGAPAETFGLIPYPQNNGTHMSVAITPYGNEEDLFTSTEFPNGSEQYIAYTYNNYTLTGELYTNGALDATTTYSSTAYCPGTIGGELGTTNNMLGNDTYGDDQFSGTVYEFRIWNGAVTPVYVAVSAAAGPGVVITNLTPQSVSISLTTTSMVGAGTQQAAVIGSFAQVSDATLTSAATNWVSSNPSVLSVNSSGLITAINGGTATVSATVNGVTGTSETISVATTPPVFSQKPANLTLAVNDTATFSAVGLGGSLSYQWDYDSNPIMGATNATLVLSNLALTNAGTYSVLVSNDLGSTNASATLTVEQAILEHRYSFISTASDSVGGPAWNGTLVTGLNGSVATIDNGLSLPGTSSGNAFGESGYLSLPQGILTNTTSITIETWVTQNTQNNWATVWDFADNGGINFELCPFNSSGRNGGLMFSAFTPDNNEDDLDSDVVFPSGSEQYVAETVNAAELLATLYTNAIPVGTLVLPNSSFLPHNIGGAGGTIQDMLGNDTFGDDQFDGTIYEFRIWDGAVTPLYLAVSAAAGPSVVVTNLTPTSVSVTVTNYTMIQGQSQPGAALGNFAQVTGVNLTVAATNWTSSDTSVLTVNSDGMITAVGTGNATISATVAGVMGSSTSISVPTSPPTIIQQPEASVTLLQGATLHASVGTIGTTPITYYWYFNSGATPISISTSPTLTISDIQPGNAGTYNVLVSNVDGTIPLSSNEVVTVVAPSAYDQAILQYGPIAYWPLDETSGSTAYDVVGGYNGTYTNFPSVVGSSYTLGEPGPSESFFGSSSTAAQFVSAIVDIPEGPFNITGPITTVAWVQLEVGVSGFDGLFGHGDLSWRMSINSSSGNNSLADEPGANDGNLPADATSPAGIDDGNWHMVAYTYTGNTNQANNGSLYVDGVLVANNAITSTPPGDGLDVWIGGSPDYGTARLLPDANIAHVAVFNKAFTEAQVQGVYNGSFVLGPQTINAAKSGRNIVLSWQTGTLLQSTNLLGPWTTNSAATSPYTVPTTNSTEFYQLLVNP